MHYKILQIKKALVSTGTYLFMSYDYAKKHDFDLRDYDVVYEGEKDDYYGHEDTLESLFFIFNCKQPKDFKGHSLSVSDIVELDGSYYYCDFAGWKHLNKLNDLL